MARPAVRSADASVFLLYTLLSVVFTWPLATGLAELAPAHFDPPFTAWRLGWIAHQIGHPGHLFDGNIFWPDRRTLAYSDAILLQGVLGAPLAALGVNPNGIANALMLFALTTSAFFAYLLAARLTGHRGAAIVAGLVFAFSSYRRVHLPHLELQWAQWMPLAFWAWHRLLDTGRMRDGLLCAGAVLLQVLSSLYYAVFLGIGLAVVGAATLIARRGRLAGAGPRRAVRRRGHRRRRGGVVREALRLRPGPRRRAIDRGDDALQRHAGQLPHGVDRTASSTAPSCRTTARARPSCSPASRRWSWPAPRWCRRRRPRRSPTVSRWWWPGTWRSARMA